MRIENKKMQEFLKQNGIKAQVKYVWTGSIAGCWRLYGKGVDWYKNVELRNKLTSLGFKDFDGSELSEWSGNGGTFSVFIRGHNELLSGVIRPF